jgi:hypothetical protein
MTKLLLQLYKPYLLPIEADEIREEGKHLGAKMYFVMADWPWIEIRGLTEKNVDEFLQKLKARDVKFRVLETSKKATKAKVQVSETLTVC